MKFLRAGLQILLVATVISVRLEAQATADSVLGHWASVGPSPVVRNAFNGQSGPQFPFSGRIGSIAVDPTDTTHWLLGVGNGGVWETRDSGGSWTPLTDGAPTLSTGAIAFDPTNPQIIYVGTGEAHGGGLAMGGVGILKSTDGGQTWTVLGASSFAKASVRRLRINPNNPSNLVAASQRGGLGRQAEDLSGAQPPYGILTSTDAGQTWSRTLVGQATSLEIDPGNFDQQYAAIGESKTGQDTQVAANGVYRSKDGGQHWDWIAGPWGSASTTQLVTGRIELAVAPSNANIIYASVARSDGNRILGLYRTDNAWDDVPSWRQISTVQAQSDIVGGEYSPGTYCIACNYAHVLSVHPADPDTVFAGGKVQLSRCTKCGSAPSWVMASSDLKTDNFADQQEVAWAGNRLILGNDGGIFSTTDLGAHWQNHNAPISTTMFYNGMLHPTDPNFMIGGTRDHATIVKKDSSSVWSSVPQPQNNSPTGGESEVALSFQRPETDWMIGNFDNNGIYRTTDAGKTVIRADNGIDRTTSSPFIPPVRKCPANDDVFLTGTTRLWRTDNFFSSTVPSWSLNGPTPIIGVGLIVSITYDASDTSCNTYAYGTYSGEIRLTRDGGKTWANLDPNKATPVFGVNGIAFDPTNRDTIYIAKSQYSTGPRIQHVFKTTNASSATPTWVNISPPENVPFDSVEVDARNPNIIYAGSDTGLWISGNAGAAWQKLGPDRGLPHAAIYDIKTDPANNRTVLFTHGRGAFAATDIQTDFTRTGFTIPASNTLSLKTPGASGQTLVGYGRIEPTDGVPPNGLAIFSYRPNNILVTEATVPATAALSAGRIYAEISTSVNTGIAIANPNDQTVNITFYFTGATGAAGTGSMTVPANGQIAAFLDQAPFNSAKPLTGSFTFSSSVPVAVTALRGRTNERGDFLITTLPVTDLSDTATASPVVFPHYADGGGWATQLALVNPGDSVISGSLQFVNDQGAVTLTVGYTIPARGAQTVKTPGTGTTIQKGSVRVLPSSGSTAPGGVAIFSFRPNGITVSEAGVAAATTGSAFQVYVESAGDFNGGTAGSMQSGIAIANLSNSAATVNVEVRALDGTSIGSSTITVPANGQSASFLNQIPGLTLPQTFQCTLRIVSDSPISLIGLRSRYNERGDFLTTTTPPINEAVAPPAGALFFPHFAEAGGYSTQFILFNTSAATASGGLRLILQSGAPAALPLQ